MTRFSPTPSNQNMWRYRAGKRDVLNNFAEALAECGDVTHAAAMVGKSADYGRVLLARIKRDLGEQAA